MIMNTVFILQHVLQIMHSTTNVPSSSIRSFDPLMYRESIFRMGPGLSYTLYRTISIDNIRSVYTIYAISKVKLHGDTYYIRRHTRTFDRSDRIWNAKCDKNRALRNLFARSD